MRNILFVCTGNSCRSVMAEGFLRDLSEKRGLELEVSSAGIGAFDGYPATPETVSVMGQHAIDMAGHRSRRLTRKMVDEADGVFVMETFHRDVILKQWPDATRKVHLLAQYAGTKMPWGNEIDIPDPIRMSPAFYQNVSRMIRDCVDGLAEKLGGPAGEDGKKGKEGP